MMQEMLYFRFSTSTAKTQYKKITKQKKNKTPTTL